MKRIWTMDSGRTRAFPTGGAGAIVRGTLLGAGLLLGACGGGGGGGSSGNPVLSGEAGLVALEFSAGTLSPAFDPAVTTYELAATDLTLAVEVSAMPSAANATVQVNGASASPGVPFGPLPLARSGTQILVVVTAEDGVSQRAYLVRAQRASLAPESYLKATNTGAEDGFSRVALSGNTLVVGATGDDSRATGVDGSQTDNGAEGSGAVHVWVHDGQAWSPQAYLKASNTEAGDSFGQAVAIDGDTLVVGAPLESSGATGVGGVEDDNSQPGSGAAYVFVRDGGAWHQQAYLKATDGGEFSFFGIAVAISGDTVVVGAPGVDEGALDSGSAHVFVRSAGVWRHEARLRAPTPSLAAAFGISVSVCGEITAIGAMSEDSGGAVHVFRRRQGGGWEHEEQLRASNREFFDQFGFSLALSGETIAVGASFVTTFFDAAEDSDATGVNGDGDNNRAPGSGAVYVFTYGPAGWNQDAYIKASNTGAGDLFGRSLALDGDKLVVGAHFEDARAFGVDDYAHGADERAVNSGAAYVLVRENGAWHHHSYLKASNTQSGAPDEFGTAVALSGDLIAVGAPSEDSSASGVGGDPLNDNIPDSGAVYTFR